MAVTANHFRLAMNFTLGGQETGQCGLTLMASDTSLPPLTAVDAALPERTLELAYSTVSNFDGTLITGFNPNDAGSLSPAAQLEICDLARIFINGNKAAFDSQVSFTNVTLTPLDENRAQVAPPAVFTFTTPITGTAAAASAHPWFMSWAVGWRGAFNGPSQRGRFYWPATAAPLTQTTRAVSSGLISTMTTTLNGLFQDLNNDWSVRPVIVHGTSALLPPSTVYNTYSDIVQLRINNNLDTMKTRGNSFPRVYSDYIVQW